MSHITDVKLRVRDLDVTEQVGDILGFRLNRGQTHHAWYEHFVGDSNRFGDRDPKTFGQCAHVLQLKDHKQGDYEIGLVAAPDGDGYDLIYDAWGPGRRLEAKAGSDLTKFRQEYSAAVAMKKAKAKLGPQGFVAKQRQAMPDGRIRLRLAR